MKTGWELLQPETAIAFVPLCALFLLCVSNVWIHGTRPRLALAFRAARDARTGGLGRGAEVVSAVETEPQPPAPGLPPPTPQPAEGSNQRQDHGEPERDDYRDQMRSLAA